MIREHVWNDPHSHLVVRVMRFLDQFQMDAVDKFAAWGRGILGDRMGLRKTATSLAWLEALSVTGPNRILFVVPGNVVGHWIEEAEEWFPTLTMVKGTAPKERRRERLSQVAHSTGDVGYVTTYGSMREDDLYLKAAKFDVVVFDEAHRLKGRTTQVAKAAKMVTKDVPHLLFVTGTKVLNGAEELWFYLHLLDRKRYTSFWDWAHEHFHIELRNFGGKNTRLIGGIKPGHEALLRAELANVLVERELADVFNVEDEPWIAEPEWTTIDVELSTKERKLYEALVEHEWAVTDAGVTVTSANKLALTTRLRQLSSDWGNLDSGLEAGTKVKAAVELIEDLVQRKPVVVFAAYKPTVHLLVEALRKKRIRACAYTGDETQAQRDEAVKQFGKQYDVIVGTLASMREGVDGLQHATNQVVMLDLDWVYEMNMQAIGRVRRSGATEQAQVFVIYAKDTMDVSVVDANLRKLNVDRALKGRRLAEVVFGKLSGNRKVGAEDTQEIQLKES